MRITYSNDNIRFTIEDEDYEHIREMVAFILDHPQSQSPEVRESVQPVPVKIPELVQPPVPIEPDIVPYENMPDPNEVRIPNEVKNPNRVEESETNEVRIPCEVVVAPKSKKQYDEFLLKINITSIKDCLGKYDYLTEYFKCWNDEKSVMAFTQRIETDPNLKLIHKNPNNHLRWIFHIICSITQHYKFFNSRWLELKREHYHRLRSGFNLKKLESKSIE